MKSIDSSKENLLYEKIFKAEDIQKREQCKLCKEESDCLNNKKYISFPMILIILIESDQIGNLNIKKELKNDEGVSYELYSIIEAGTNMVYYKNNKNGLWFNYNDNKREEIESKIPIVLFYKLFTNNYINNNNSNLIINYTNNMNNMINMKENYMNINNIKRNFIDMDKIDNINNMNNLNRYYMNMESNNIDYINNININNNNMNNMNENYINMNNNNNMNSNNIINNNMINMSMSSGYSHNINQLNRINILENELNNSEQQIVELKKRMKD